MMQLWTRPLSRRAWLARHAVAVAATRPWPRARHAMQRGWATWAGSASAGRGNASTTGLDPHDALALAHHALDAAHDAGARYADVRLTRKVGQDFKVYGLNSYLRGEAEVTGLGVRALVDGYWGFAACPWWTANAAVECAREAVAQARINARGVPRTVDLGTIPAATGTWTTPVRIDPFHISIEEKLDFFHWIQELARHVGLYIPDPVAGMTFVREERIVATSDGGAFVQTFFTSEGNLPFIPDGDQSVNADGSNAVTIQGIDPAAKGWEMLLDANIPAQLTGGADILGQHRAVGRRPFTVGRKTIVADGATMAALVDATFGLATQLDRALGYEANTAGTSFLDDPLGMLGTAKVAAPMVTITANRSVPTQLATVRWDDEGIVPDDFPLVREGLLVDFQTTREQAAWLAPYYMKRGHPVRSHGCAGAEDALVMTMQHCPNLALEPGPSGVRLEDLISDVPDGILIIGGKVWQPDPQCRNGLLAGTMREIRNGKLGAYLTGGVVMYNTKDLWQHVAALAGPASVGRVMTEAGNGFIVGQHGGGLSGDYDEKGQPVQVTRHTVQAVAALLPSQPIIDLARKA